MPYLYPRFDSSNAPLQVTYVCVRRSGGRHDWRVLLPDGKYLGNCTTNNVAGHRANFSPPGTKLHVTIEKEAP